MERDILIIDDDAHSREALGDLLEAAGYHVAGMSHGLEALDYLRDHDPPGLILCDLAMPVMNGWVFRSEQQRNPTLANIPVVLISGIHDAESAAEYLHAEAYLQKPLDPEALFLVVRRFCGYPADLRSRESRQSPSPGG